MKIFSTLILVTILCTATTFATTNLLKEIATDFKFTEGPTLAANGDIYFSDVRNNRIHIWSTKGELSTYREDSGGANGLMFDKNGNLIVCEGKNRRVTSISPSGKVTVLADSFDGKKLNSPNDLWVMPNGDIYFTDPRYGSKDNLEQTGENVYYISHEKKPLQRVIADMVRPNGIVGTPDGKTLYVADHGGNKTFSYTVAKNGTLSNKKLVVESGSDGMTLDSDGNLYITSDAVYKYSQAGDLLQKIDIPKRPTNVCFRKDGKMLFVTARTSIYSKVIDK